MNLVNWVTDNCTEEEQTEFFQGLERQVKMFESMEKNGILSADANTGKFIFSPQHRAQWDYVWLKYHRRFEEATHQV